MASEADKEFLAYTLLAEAEGGGMGGMAAVAFVIRNRTDSGLYSSDAVTVVREPDQFAGSNSNNIAAAKKRAEKDPAYYNMARTVVDQVIYADKPPPDPTGNALFFTQTGYKATWSNAVTTKYGTQNIGGNTFYSREKPGSMAQTASILTAAHEGKPAPTFATATAATAYVAKPQATSPVLAYQPAINDITGGGVLSNGYVVKSTPFTTDRAGQITGVVFHHTAASTLSSALNTAGKTGAQYYIDRDGSIYQYAADGKKVVGIREKGDPFRTDKGSYTEEFGNNTAIHVEIVGKDENDINPDQIAAAAQLGAWLAQQYNLSPDAIIGHGDLQGGPGGNRRPLEGILARDAARLLVEGLGVYEPNFVRPEFPGAGMPVAPTSTAQNFVRPEGQPFGMPGAKRAPADVSAQIERMANDVVVSRGVISRKRMAEADVYNRSINASYGIASETTPILIANDRGEQISLIDMRPAQDTEVFFDMQRGAFITKDAYSEQFRAKAKPAMLDVSAIDMAVAMQRPATEDLYAGMYDDGKINTGGKTGIVQPNTVRPEGPAAGLPKARLATEVKGRPDTPVGPGSLPAASKPPVYTPQPATAGETVERILDNYRTNGAAAAAQAAVDAARAKTAPTPIVAKPTSTTGVKPPTQQQMQAIRAVPAPVKVATPPPRPIGSLPAANENAGVRVATPPERPVGSMPAEDWNRASSIVSKPVSPVGSMPAAPAKTVSISKQVPVVTYVERAQPAAKPATLTPPTQTIDPAMRNAMTALAPGQPTSVPPVPLSRPAGPAKLSQLGVPQVPMDLGIPPPKKVKVVTYKTVTVQVPATQPQPIVKIEPTYEVAGYTYKKQSDGSYKRTGKAPGNENKTPSQIYADANAKSVDKQTGGSGGNPVWYDSPSGGYNGSGSGGSLL